MGHELIRGAKQARGAAREWSGHAWECDFPRGRIFWFLAGADRRRCWRSCGWVGCCCWRPIKLAEFVLHFLRQSIAAGTDVAWRALDPRLPLQPGFVVYHAQLPPGTKRDTFCAIMSLLPGTLPCGPAEGNGLIIHCLDVTQPVVEQLAAEEALCMQTLGGAQRNG